MDDAQRVTASASGLIARAVQSVQGLHDYYEAYSRRVGDIESLQMMQNSLLESLIHVKNKLKSGNLDTARKQDVEDALEQCEDSIRDLSGELVRVQQSSSFGEKKQYAQADDSFKYETLPKLRLAINDVRDELSFDLQTVKGNSSRRGLENVNFVLSSVQTRLFSSEILSWLEAPDVTTNFLEASEKRHGGTGLWIFRTPEYVDWIRTPNSLLWLHGPAGCGKTVLSSTIIRSLWALKVAQLSKTVGVSFFYFSFQDYCKQQESHLLRALVLQLSQQLGPIGTEFVKRLYRNNNILFKDSVRPPSQSELLGLLRRLIAQFHDVFVVIDALDESQRGDRNVHARGNVLAILQTFRSWNLPDLHILTTSRYHSDIHNSLIDPVKQIHPEGRNLDAHSDYEIQSGPAPRPLIQDLPMNNSGVDDDITTYVSDFLKSDGVSSQTPHLHGMISKVLTAKSNGIFRWAHCQLLNLSKDAVNEANLENWLASLTPTLDLTYNSMLLNVKKEDKKKAVRLLRMLCFAKRRMTVPEVLQAVTVVYDSDEKGDKPPTSQPKIENDDGSAVLQIVPGFVEIVRERVKRLGQIRNENHISIHDSPHYLYKRLDRDCVYYVQIAHYSVYEYLLEHATDLNHRPQDFQIQAQESHWELARICLTYLLNSEFATKRISYKILYNAAFGFYAAQFWHEHFKELSNCYPEIYKLIEELFMHAHQAFENSIRVYDPVTPKASILCGIYRVSNFRHSKLYYASWLGFENIALRLLEERTWGAFPSEAQEISREGLQVLYDRVDTAQVLCIAIQKQQEKLVDTLLDKGVEIHHEPLQHAPPLLFACRANNIELARRLLDRGVDIHLSQFDEPPALHMASAYGSKELVKLFFERGVKGINYPREPWDRPLDVAIIHDNADVVSMLIERGAEAQIALAAAARAGSKRYVQMLLDAGADLNAVVHRYSSSEREHCLALAVRAGHASLVEFLIGKGAAVNPLPDRLDFSHPLHYAAHDEDDMLFYMTLKQRPSIEASLGKMRVAPLTHAVAQNDEGITQLLLVNGAQVSTFDLMLAARNRNSQIMALLIEKGFKVDAKSRETVHWGWIFWMSALYSAHECVKLLLRCGADPLPRGSECALRAAASNGDCDIVESLLEVTADTAQPNWKYEDALTSAVLRGILLGDNTGGDDFNCTRERARAWRTVQFLLEAGAAVDPRPTSLSEPLSFRNKDSYVEAESICRVKLLVALLDRNASETLPQGAIEAWQMAMRSRTGNQELSGVRTWEGYVLSVQKLAAERWISNILQEAVTQGDGASVEALLRLAHKTNETLELDSALITAQRYSHREIASLLVSKGAKKDFPKMLQMAIDHSIDGYPREVQGAIEFLLESGADLEAKFGNKSQILRALLDRLYRRFPLILDTHRCSVCPLVTVRSALDDTQLLQFFLDRGILADVKDNWKMSTRRSIVSGRLRSLKKLYEHGLVLPNQRSGLGRLDWFEWVKYRMGQGTRAEYLGNWPNIDIKFLAPTNGPE